MKENWRKGQKSSEREKDIRALKKVKEGRKYKKYRMVKISDRPLTYKEVEIK